VVLLGAAAVVVVGADPVLVAGAYVLSNWIAAIAAVYFLVRYTPILDSSLGWTPKYREMLVFSLPLMTTTGLSFILGNTDTLMLQYFLGSEDVGVYDIGYTIAQMLTVGVGSLSYLFLPNVSSLHSEGKIEEITHLYKLVTKWVVFITIPPYLILVFFSGEIISIFGNEYAAGVPYLLILASAYFINAVTGPDKTILTSAGDTRFILYVNVFTAALNIVLNLSLILAYGAIGAAIASAVSLVSVHVLYCHRIYSTFNITPYSPSLLKPVVPFLALSGIGYLLVRNTLERPSLVQSATLVIITGGIYGVMILSLGGLQEEDVMLVRSAEQSLGVDLELIKRIARQFM
jgi:O-antigen/teichoic acid export membrane protein